MHCSVAQKTLPYYSTLEAARPFTRLTPLSAQHLQPAKLPCTVYHSLDNTDRLLDRSLAVVFSQTMRPDFLLISWMARGSFD